MLIHRRSRATTTPRFRAEIRASTEAAWIVGERYGILEQSVCKERKRDSLLDRSHRPQRLQTTLTLARGSHRGGTAPAPALAGWQPLGGGAGVPEPAALALGARPLPQLAWGRPPEGPKAERAEARAQAVQGFEGEAIDPVNRP